MRTPEEWPYRERLGRRRGWRLVVVVRVRFQAKIFPTPQGIHKIRHVVVIMQENRSFDSYFGTFPGADGIPMRTGSRRV